LGGVLSVRGATFSFSHKGVPRSDLNFDPDFEMSEEELWERFTTYIKMAYSLEGLNRRREAAEAAH
jgi:hypothetical protein